MNVMQLNRTTFALALIFLGLLPGLVQAQAWYAPSGWLYRKAITIDFTKVGAGGPHANYPVLISRGDTDLQTKAQTDADDILFTSSDGTTKLSHEIESYVSASGTIVAWVKIPSLSSSADTVIYMYYGNASATSQQDGIGTWDANFKGVWHLNNAFLDATSNNANGTNTGSTNVTGKISNGRGFVRSDGADFIQITGLMGSPTSFTLSAWATLTTPDTNAAEIISLGDNSVLRYDENSANRTSGVAYTGAGIWTTTGSAINYAGTGWHYVVYTFDDVANSQKLYVDGIQRGSTTATATPLYTSGGTNTFIGKHGNANVNMDFDGTIDEVRVANASRSVGWVLTEFNNQNAPSTFATAGTEAKTYYSLANGNWNTAATWSNISHTGAAASTAPGTADYVVIGNSDIVTLTANATNNTEVRINSTGTLNMATFTISGTGSFSLNSGATLGIGSTAGITSSGATGNVQVTGTRTFNTAANYTYNGTAAQVPGNGLPATVNNLTTSNAAGVTLSANVVVSANLTVTSGTLNLSTFTANRASAGGNLTVANGASLRIGGTNTLPSNFSTHSIGATSTIEYSGTTQSVIVLNSTQNYGHLTISGSGTKALAGSIGISGTLTLTAGTLSSNNLNISLGGNWTNNSTFTAGTGAVTFNGSGAQTISGSSTTTFYNLTVTKAAGTATALVVFNVDNNLNLTQGTLTVESTSPYIFKNLNSSSGTTFNQTPASPGSLYVTGDLAIDGTYNALYNSSLIMQNAGGVNYVRTGTATGALVSGQIYNGISFLFFINGDYRATGAVSCAGIAYMGNATAGTFETQGYTATFPITIINGGSLLVNAGGGGASAIFNSTYPGWGIRVGYANSGGSMDVASGSTVNASQINIGYDATHIGTVTHSGGTVNTGHFTIESGSSYTGSNSPQINVTGNWTNNGGTFTPGLNTVAFNGTGAQSIAGPSVTTFNNLTISNTGNTVTSGVNSSVAGNLSVASGTFDLGAYAANRASAGGTLLVASSAKLKIGGTNTLPANYSTHSLAFASTIEYAGTNQTVAALNSGQEYNGLTISGSGTKTLAGDLNVAGNLTLTSGTITTGAYTLYIKATGNVFRVSGWVIGNFKRRIATGSPSRIFDVGDASNYTPVTLAFASVTTAGDLTVSVTSGDHANIGASTINAAKSVNRNWTLTNSGIVFATYGATFTFVPGDVDGGANTDAFIVGKYSGGSWTYPTVGTKTATTTQATGLTAFSDFAIGEMASLLKTWDGGAGTSNWGDAANWNTDGVPTSANDVDLTGADTININVAAATNSLTLNNAGLTLTILSGNSLATSANLTLTSGTLNTAEAFPTVAGTVNVAGGTVGFTGSGAQTIPALSYNNLISSSSGARTLASSGTIGIAGAFTPGTNTYTVTGSTIDYNAAGAQTIAAFNYNNLTLSNSGVKTFASGTSGIASAVSTAGSATANATTNSSTISYNGSTNQTISALTYHGLNISSTGGTVTGINTTVTNFSIDSGTLDLNTFTLTTTGTATYTAGTINNGTVTSTGATTTFAGTVFGAIVNATSNLLNLNGSTFNNVVTLTKNGATNVLSNGGNTFNNTANIGNSGSGYWALANVTADIFNTSVIFTNTGSNALFMAFNAPGNQFNGNVTFNNTGAGGTINSSFGGGATATYSGNIIVNNTSTGGISFGAAGGLTTLADTKTISIGATGFNAGPLYLYFLTQLGTTPQSLTLTGTAALIPGYSSTFNGNVNFVAPQIILNGATFNGTAYIEKNGATQNNSLGGNVFNGATTLVSSTTSSTAYFVLGFPTGIDIFNGDLTLTNTGASGIYPAFNTAGHQFNGNIILNQTTGANISFNAGTGTSTLATGKTISVGGTGFSSGILSLPKFTQAGSTAQAFSLTGTAALHLGPSSTFNGNVNFTAPQLLLNGSTFNGTATLAKTGATNNNSNGGNTFASTAAITNSGAGWLAIGYVSADIFNGETTFNNNSAGGFYVAHNSAGNQFNGNVTYNNLSAAGSMYSYFGATATAAYNGNIVVNNTSAGGIYFGAAGGTATLAATKTMSIGPTGFATGILSMSFLTQSGSTPQALALTGTALLQIGLSTTFNGNVSFTAPQLVLSGGTFNGTASLTKNGATDNTGNGGSTFNSTATITNSGTGFLRLANTTADDFNGDATFIQTGSGLLQPAYATNSTFAGNVSTTGTATAILFGTGTGTVTLNGTAAQSIGGSLLTTFNNLTINNGSGITLGTNAMVNSVLTFTSGTVTTNSNEVYLGSAGSVARTSGHVVGNFKKHIATGATTKSFEIGDASNYAPVAVAFASITTAGDLTARTASGDHANIATSTLDSAKTVNRNWTLTNSGIAFTNYGATFTFVAGDLDGGATSSAFIVGSYSGGWTYPTVGARTSTTTQATGITTFGDFQIGEPPELPPNVSLVNSVTPLGTQEPGTDLVYNVIFTNDGGLPAQVFVVVDPIPANTDFKLGSASAALGTTGLTSAIAYSNDNGVTYTYTPVSAAGGAPAGYDRFVTHIRWTFSGNLSQTSPNNSGSISFTTRVR